MSTTSDVVIVGASLGGVSVAEALRREGHRGPITLVNAEGELPYDRPPLSKAVLREPDRPSSEVWLRPKRWFAENGVTVLSGNPATSLDVAERRLTIAGRALHGHEIVIATGSRALPLDVAPVDPDVFTIRTWGQAVRLGNRLRRPGRLVVIGGGFIGLEVAAAAIESGWQVTVVQREPAVLSRVLPSTLGAICWQPYDRAGATLHPDAVVTSVARTSDRLQVALADATTLPADAVVVAVGGTPNVEWLDSETIEIGSGIRCDGWGRTSVEHVWAVGDVAQWDNRWSGRADRIEQWHGARNHAHIVSRAMLGREIGPWAEPPYFWSDLLGGRIQFLGECTPDAIISIHREGRRLIGLAAADGVLRGVFTHRFPRAIAAARALLVEPTSVKAARTWADQLLTPARFVPDPPIVAPRVLPSLKERHY